MWFILKILLGLVILISTTYLLAKFFKEKSDRKIEYLLTGIILPLLFFIYPLLPSDNTSDTSGTSPTSTPMLTETIQPSAKLENEPATLTDYRYDMYDDEEIIKRIEAINDDLSHDGKHINEDLLKAFIYALNGDYSLMSSQDVFFEIVSVFGNVDVDFVNIVRNYKSPSGEFQFSDECTIIDSIANVFRDPDEYEYVLYWQAKYNTLKSSIYELGMSDERIADIDNYCIDFFNAFSGNKPVNISSDKQRDIYGINANALFAITCCISIACEQLPISPFGGSRDETITLDPINSTQISTTALSDVIRQINEKYLNIMYERVVNN